MVGEKTLDKWSMGEGKYQAVLGVAVVDVGKQQLKEVIKQV